MGLSVFLISSVILTQERLSLPLRAAAVPQAICMDVNGAVWCLVWAPAGAGGAAVNGTASLPQEPASEGLGWISRPQAELRPPPPQEQLGLRRDQEEVRQLSLEGEGFEQKRLQGRKAVLGQENNICKGREVYLPQSVYLGNKSP